MDMNMLGMLVAVEGQIWYLPNAVFSYVMCQKGQISTVASSELAWKMLLIIPVVSY